MILTGDSLVILPTLEPESFDAIVTDPPYEIGFMGHGWDGAGVTFQAETWAAILRVAKPGAWLLAFGGTRTVHRETVAIEDAGWEIRDLIVWAYAQGFPKSRASLKPAWEPIVVARKPARRSAPLRVEEARLEGGGGGTTCPDFPEPCRGHEGHGRYGRTFHAQPEKPAGWWTDPGAGPKFDGIYNGGKPYPGRPGDLQVDAATIPFAGDADAEESARNAAPWTNAPRYEGPAAVNVRREKVGDLQVDAAALPIADDDPVNEAVWTSRPSVIRPGTTGFITSREDGDRRPARSSEAGRWPANLMLTAPIFDGEFRGVVGGGEVSTSAPFRSASTAGAREVYGHGGEDYTGTGYTDSGLPSRFFLIPKADRADREPLPGRFADGLPDRKPPGWSSGTQSPGTFQSRPTPTPARKNVHPTVKPTALMRHLCRLVTPPGGRILDPFLGSGTTAIAAALEGFEVLGIEREPEYVEIAEVRLASYAEEIRNEALRRGQVAAFELPDPAEYPDDAVG